MTTYRAAGAELRIGHRSRTMDAVLHRWRVPQAAIIGAANPFSRRKPEAWNRRMDAALRCMVRHLPHAASQGRWRTWSEPAILVGCSTARAAVLARRFRQVAIVVARQGRPASLVLLQARPAWHPCASPAAPSPAPPTA